MMLGATWTDDIHQLHIYLKFGVVLGCVATPKLFPFRTVDNLQ